MTKRIFSNNINGIRVALNRGLATEVVDSFRMFNNEPNQYSWWSYRANAREKILDGE